MSATSTTKKGGYIQLEVGQEGVGEGKSTEASPRLLL